ncbi:MAG: hypothetical protein HDT13_10685 [Butyrivibrio sp.]|nr:hypothetical protein [Butyrivibrio sp.]
MKKTMLLTLILSILAISIPYNVRAAEDIPAAAGEEYIEYFDGGYIINSLVDVYDSAVDGSLSTYATQITTKSATSSVYDSNNKLVAEFVLTATFTYNGSSATCIDALYTTQIYDKNWKFTDASVDRASNYATGNYTIKKTLLFITQATANGKLTMTCDKNGNVTVK